MNTVNSLFRFSFSLISAQVFVTQALLRAIREESARRHSGKSNFVRVGSIKDDMVRRLSKKLDIDLDATDTDTDADADIITAGSSGGGLAAPQKPAKQGSKVHFQNVPESAHACTLQPPPMAAALSSHSLRSLHSQHSVHSIPSLCATRSKVTTTNLHATFESGVNPDAFVDLTVMSSKHGRCAIM